MKETEGFETEGLRACSEKVTEAGLMQSERKI